MAFELDWCRLSSLNNARRHSYGPLVSCICLTRGVHRHLSRAVACFEAQTYLNSELIVIFVELDQQSKELLYNHPEHGKRIKLWQVPEHHTIGKRRNFGYESARGEFFATWDDDDWHAPTRLAWQMGTIIGANKQACVLHRVLLFDETTQEASLSTERGWENTLVCRREIPRFPIKWPELDRGEDTKLIRELERSCRLAVTADSEELYVYTFHGKNIWNQEHHHGMRGEALTGDESDRISRLLDHEREARRAGGDVICETCGKDYYRHPMDPSVLTRISGEPEPFLHLLCDGSRVKL